GDNYFGYDIKVKKAYNFGKLGDKYVSVAYLTSSKYSTEQIISAVKTKNTVVKAQPNYKKKALSLTDDTYAKYQWALDNNGQNGGTSDKDLNPEAVWNSGVTSSEKVIAIVDTGFDFKNEELKDNVWTNENTRDLPGLHGYDFVNLDTNPQDDNGHGSHCAGIIAATANNQKGISGINQSAKIMALKVLDEEGSGYDSDILAAFNYIYEAQNLGINVASVNCSLGGKGDGDSVFKDIFDAIGKKGALICVSAGNESSNNDEYGVAPANVNSPYVISVAASNENDELASFSNYGTEKVDVAAPGTNILSTVSYDCYNPTIYDSERQNRVSQFFTDFNDNVNIIKIGKERNTLGTISVEKSTDTYFGTEGSSAKITIKGARQGDCFYVKIPYTAVGDAKKTDTVKDSFKILMQGPNADNNKEESLLTFVDTVDNELAVKSALGLDGYYFSNKRNYWSHIDLTPASIQKDGQQRALTLAVAVNDDYDEDFVLYIDDLGISKPTEDTSIFEKYDFYNGTSMATPYVTGAVALLSDFHKDLSPIQLKALVMNSVRKTQELSQKIVSGGVFDLSKALTTDSIAPIISNAKSGNKQITVEGVYFGKTPSAYINGTQ
ncbi:MAG: S8 family serine peptidase, partial [Clostridia bacterium]|nr:S8 family serine peptidase [Clostridia bacterium]